MRGASTGLFGFEWDKWKVGWGVWHVGRVDGRGGVIFLGVFDCV